MTSFYTLITIENCVIRNKEEMMNNNDEDDEMKLKEMRLYFCWEWELLRGMQLWVGDLLWRVLHYLYSALQLGTYY